MPKRKTSRIPLTRKSLDPLIFAVADGAPKEEVPPLNDEEKAVFQKVVGIEYQEFKKQAATETRGVLMKGLKILWQKLQEVDPNYYSINLKNLTELLDKLETEAPPPTKSPSTVHNHLHISDGKVAVAELLSKLTGKPAPREVSRLPSRDPSPVDLPLAPTHTEYPRHPTDLAPDKLAHPGT